MQQQQVDACGGPNIALHATNLMEALRQAVKQHFCRFERLRQIRIAEARRFSNTRYSR